MTTQGRPTYANQRWIEAIDRSEEVSLSRTTWIDPFHPNDRAAASAALESAVSQRSDFHLELRFKEIDGTFRWAACLGAPHFAPDGRIVSYVGICCDISAKHHAESTLNEVAAKLVAAQESERGRIARELHDDLGQQVALLASRLEALLREQKLPRSRMHAALLEARTNLQEIAVTIHSLSHELHPAKLKLLGLALTLETLCRDVAADNRVTVHFHDDRIPSHLDETVALCIFRVAQEALQNAVKHSGAGVIDVYVSADDVCITLQVSDNGAGFDPLLGHSTGLGLLTMRERAELIGGRLELSTTPPHGTTVTVTVPMTRGAGRLA
jgi:PAS domain S-box-containing protein